jgi:hypothetical protein
VIEMKHTPGPWKHDGEIIYSGNYTLNNGWTNHATIAKVEDHANWEANARLIAAAPDLLEALKKISKELRVGNDRLKMIETIETLTNGAIAKAEEE